MLKSCLDLQLLCKSETYLQFFSYHKVIAVKINLRYYKSFMDKLVKKKRQKYMLALDILSYLKI